MLHFCQASVYPESPRSVFNKSLRGLFVLGIRRILANFVLEFSYTIKEFLYVFVKQYSGSRRFYRVRRGRGNKLYLFQALSIKIYFLLFYFLGRCFSCWYYYPVKIGTKINYCRSPTISLGTLSELSDSLHYNKINACIHVYN